MREDPLPTSPLPSTGSSAPPRVRRHMAATAVLLGVGAVATSLLIEWLGWGILWRMGTPRQLDAAWWWEFTSGAFRTASAAALVSACAVLLLALFPPSRRWLRPRLLAVFGAGMAVFLLMVLGLTIWGSFAVP